MFQKLRNLIDDFFQELQRRILMTTSILWRDSTSTGSIFRLEMKKKTKMWSGAMSWATLVQWRGYESWVCPGWRQPRRSSGTGWTSCCRRTRTCGLRDHTKRHGENHSANSPHSFQLSWSAACSPRFCLYSDLSPICKSWFSKMTPLFLQTNLWRASKAFSSCWTRCSDITSTVSFHCGLK